MSKIIESPYPEEILADYCPRCKRFINDWGGFIDKGKNLLKGNVLGVFKLSHCKKCGTELIKRKFYKIEA